MSNMQKIMRGVVRDHKIPNPDLFHPYNSTNVLSKKFIKTNLIWAGQKMGTDDAIPVPIFTIGFLMLGAFQLAAMYVLYKERSWLSKMSLFSSHGHINTFWSAKTNPDIHYNALDNLYTDDKQCGIRQLPKRPWLSFKDPEATMKRVALKHNH